MYGGTHLIFGFINKVSDWINVLMVLTQIVIVYITLTVYW